MLVKTLNKGLVIGLMALLSCSLNNSAGETPDFNSTENAYVKKINKYKFSLVPFTSDKLASIAYSGQELTPGDRDSIKKEYAEFACFVLNIDIEGYNGDICEYDDEKNIDYDALVNYYLFGMQNSLNLKEDNGTRTPCSIYYFERLNELAHSNRFIVGFKKPSTFPATVEYDNPHLNCGKINFSIGLEHLQYN